MRPRWKERGKEQGYDTSIRMYSLDELKEVLSNYGFSVEQVRGTYEGDKYDKPNSKRILIFARKAVRD
jgi:hypothetical protein